MRGLMIALLASLAIVRIHIIIAYAHIMFANLLIANVGKTRDSQLTDTRN